MDAMDGIGLKCAAVIRHASDPNLLANALRELDQCLVGHIHGSQVLSGDETEAITMDVVFLPISVTFNACMQQLGTRACKEKVVLAALACLRSYLTLSRDVTSDCTTGLVPSTREERMNMVTSTLHWVSNMAQNHAKFSEEVNVKVAEVVVILFRSILPSLTEDVRRNDEHSSDSGGGNSTIPGTLRPLIGCLASYVLDEALAVSAKGSLGCRKLVNAMLESLTCIIEYTAQDPNVLAFFLPGIVSKLSRLLIGAAGRSLTECRLAGVAGNALNAGESEVKQAVTGPMAHSSCVMSALRCFTIAVVGSFRKTEKSSPRGTGESYCDDDGDAKCDVDTSIETLRRLVLKEPKEDKQTRGIKSSPATPPTELVVNRDNDWFASSASKVEAMLQLFLPTLCGHTSHSVLVCVKQCACQLMHNASFEESRSVFECLLALHDLDGEDLVDGMRVNRIHGPLRGLADELLSEYSNRLLSSVKSTATFTLLAKRLKALFHFGGCSYMEHLFIDKPVMLSRLLETLRQCFSFNVLKSLDSTAAMIWVKNPASTSKGSGRWMSTTGECAVLLPRMQPGLAFLHSPDHYNAVASLCRTFGRICLETQCVKGVRVFDFATRAYTEYLLCEGPKDDIWCLKAASACVALNEVIFGCKTNEQKGEDGSSEMANRYLGRAIASFIEEYASENLWEKVLNEANPKMVPLGCAMLEAFGVFSRVLGAKFKDGHEFLPAVLYCLLDKLEDANCKLQEAAELSLMAICANCGYSCLADLLLENSDFLIDVLVRHLHHLQLYPHSPQLFKVIVRAMDGDNSIHLLGLVREPFQSINSSMSVCARHLHPNHINNFICIIHNMTRVCRSSLIHLKHKYEGTQGTSDHHPSKLMHHGTSVRGDIMQDRQNASMVAEMCGSLLLQCSELLHTYPPFGMIELLEAIGSAVRGLHQSWEILDDLKSELSERNAGGESKIAEKEPPKLLPSIAVLWPNLITVLKLPSQKTSVLVASLDTAVQVVNCGGRFLSSRVSKDLWPILSELVRHGKISPKGKQRSSLFSDIKKVNLEASLHQITRTRIAALDCVGHTLLSAKGREAWNKRLTLRASINLCGLLGHSEDPQLHESLSNALLCLHEVDCDAAWTSLFKIAANALPEISINAALSPVNFEPSDEDSKNKRAASNAVALLRRIHACCEGAAAN